jgi:hypothetical protein
MHLVVCKNRHTCHYATCLLEQIHARIQWLASELSSECRTQWRDETLLNKKAFIYSASHKM